MTGYVTSDIYRHRKPCNMGGIRLNRHGQCRRVATKTLWSNVQLVDSLENIPLHFLIKRIRISFGNIPAEDVYKRQGLSSRFPIFNPKIRKNTPNAIPATAQKKRRIVALFFKIITLNSQKFKMVALYQILPLK